MADSMDIAELEAGPRLITTGAAARKIAVTIDGSLDSGRLTPVVCLAGLNRNGEDFGAFVSHLHDMAAADWPVVRIDLIGRGGSTREIRGVPYSTMQDVADAVSAVRALGVHRAIWVGQNHGGQVIQMLATSHPGMIAGAVLCDSGPVIDVRGLVRLRNNLDFLADIRGETGFLEAYRQILGVAYPLLPASGLDKVALRTHRVGKRGRIEPRFDPRIVRGLDGFENSDVMSPQWQMFDALGHVPLMIMHTELSDLLRIDVFDKMAQRRPGAIRIDIPNEGSPALLEGPSEAGSLAGFVSVVSDEDAGTRVPV
ncbi:MAG TPA: alpha/beta hydrolase [Devosiaceae bacterium]|nr:alpha/beta hydrolase [Devosiaceae bacterium]